MQGLQEYRLVDETGGIQSPQAQNQRRKHYAVSAVVILLIAGLSIAVVALSMRSGRSAAADDSQPQTLTPQKQMIAEGPTTGSMTVYGRQVSYAVSASFVALDLRFSAKVTDQQTGVAAASVGYTTGQLALEYGIENLFAQLLANGQIDSLPNDAAQDEELLLTVPDAAQDEPDAAAPETALLGVGASKSGDVDVYGRKIHYNVGAYLKGLSLRYKATARDVASGISADVRGYKSGKGAVEHAVEECFKKLIAAGIVVPPTPQTVPAALATGNAVQSATYAKQGDTVVCGRSLHWTASVDGNSFTCNAVDSESGETSNAGQKTSGDVACTAAFSSVIAQVSAKGLPIDKTVNCPQQQTWPLMLVIGDSNYQHPAEAYSFVQTETLHLLPVQAVDFTADLAVTPALGKSGDVVACGRPIHWVADGYIHGLHLLYKCHAVDTGSKLDGYASGQKSGEGACKIAIGQVIQKDIAAKVPMDFEHNCPKPQLASPLDFNAIGGSAVASAVLTYSQEETAPALAGMASKSGDIDVYGRKVHYSVSGYLKGLSWRYKATATDKATGIKGSSSGYKSGKGAVEHAVENLFKTLIERGIIPPPPKPSARLNTAAAADVVDVTIVPTIIEATLEDVEDGSINSETDLQYADDAAEIDEKTLAEGAVAVLASESDSASLIDPPLVLAGLFDKSGDTVVYGRTIHYKVSGYLKGLAWRYKATARDVATGVTGSHSGTKSGEGAVKGAIENCFKELGARCIFPPCQA